MRRHVSRTTPFTAVLIVISLNAYSNVQGKNIVIHADNRTDYQALISNKGGGNFSVSTNLLALSELHSSVKFEYMTTKRSLRFMNKGESICIVNCIKTKERS